MNNSLKYCEKNKIKLLYSVGLICLIVSAFLGVLLGSTPLSLSELWHWVISGGTGEITDSILRFVRIPRTASCMVCGAALAVSGAVIQATLANRLASPSIIGVNSGAGLAVTLCTALGIFGGWRLSLFSFIGAFAAVMIVSLVSKKLGASRGTVILIGVAMNTFFNAVSDTIVTFNTDIAVLSRDFKIGDFSAVTVKKLIPAAIIVSVTLFILFTLTNELDVLTLGDDNAVSLGMNISLMRVVFLILAALLAGCAVSIAGLLSFVGLIVPHIVRRFSGGKASRLLPLCAIFGASFVTLCDTLARTAFSPYEIPVGIIMAFLGAPFFILILIKGKGGHARA